MEGQSQLWGSAWQRAVGTIAVTNLHKDMGTESCIHFSRQATGHPPLRLGIPKKPGIWILPLMAIWLWGQLMLIEPVPVALHPMFGAVADPCDPCDQCLFHFCVSLSSWREDGKGAAGLPGEGSLLCWRMLTQGTGRWMVERLM